MLLETRSRPLRLTYCSNVHPVESAEDLIGLAQGFWPALSAALRGRHGARSIAQGPWLSARAVAAFAADAFLLEAFADALIAADGHAPTANVFPQGNFHDRRVKEAVYLPDWRDEARLRYTLAAADCLAQLPAEGSYQSLSTVPGAFGKVGIDRRLIAENLGRAVAGLHILEMETERRVVLAIEPEPACLFESLDDWLRFFREEMLGHPPAALEALKPGNRDFQEELIRRHLGLCYDCCHQALAFEEPAEGFAALRAAGCEVAKIQLSTALEIDAGAGRAEALARLADFAEPRYLHQVAARRADGTIERYLDLPDFLRQANEGDWTRARVHFHVPIFSRSFGALGTTRDQLDRVLAELRRDPITELLEIETYSWGVMPGRTEETTGEDRLLADVLAEYDFVIAALAGA